MTDEPKDKQKLHGLLRGARDKLREVIPADAEPFLAALGNISQAFEGNKSSGTNTEDLLEFCTRARDNLKPIAPSAETGKPLNDLIANEPKLKDVRKRIDDAIKVLKARSGPPSLID